MKQINALSNDQLDRLIDLATGNLADVKSGEISGYGQTRDEEVADLNELINTLTIMRSL